jgi:hypothetical protein
VWAIVFFLHGWGGAGSGHSWPMGHRMAFPVGTEETGSIAVPTRQCLVMKHTHLRFNWALPSSREIVENPVAAGIVSAPLFNGGARVLRGERAVHRDHHTSAQGRPVRSGSAWVAYLRLCQMAYGFSVGGLL